MKKFKFISRVLLCEAFLTAIITRSCVSRALRQRGRERRNPGLCCQTHLQREFRRKYNYYLTKKQSRRRSRSKARLFHGKFIRSDEKQDESSTLRSEKAAVKCHVRHKRNSPRSYQFRNELSCINAFVAMCFVRA